MVILFGVHFEVKSFDLRETLHVDTIYVFSQPSLEQVMKIFIF